MVTLAAATPPEKSARQSSLGRIVLVLVLGVVLSLGSLSTSRETTGTSQRKNSGAKHHKPPHLMFQGDAQKQESVKPTESFKNEENDEVDGSEEPVAVTARTIKPYIGWQTAGELGVEAEMTKRRNEAQKDGGDDDFSNTAEKTTEARRQPLEIERSHFIYRKGTWDGSPVVVPELKLLFFTIPKVGCTVFKQLFRRIAGHSNWRKSELGGNLPHHPGKNGLRYLFHYNEEDATEMLTSPEWTRAIFVREPKDRILSAYLDKGRQRNGFYVQQHCCPRRQACVETAESSFAGFLQIIHHCRDPHWVPQSRRMERRYWPYLNFVGHIENAQEDTKRLLQSLPDNTWDLYGASGWGEDGTEQIFASTGTVKHQTGASEKLRDYYTDETERMVEALTREDFSNPLFGFELTSIVGEH